MTLAAACQVADAVLYEGYLLYPYRASSPKNQVRWQFGVLGPEGAVAAGVGEPPSMSCELLVEARPDATVDLRVRFLQVQSRTVERCSSAGWAPAQELVVGATRWMPFQEAVPREIVLAGLTLGGDQARELRLPGGREVEQLYDDGRLVGRLVRTRQALLGALTLTSRPGVDPRLLVVGVRVDNRARWEPADVPRTEPGWTARDAAARSSFVSTHLLLTATGTRVVSLLDGPDWAAADAKRCRQSRCWPVLIADDAGVDAVLVSPIILADHPVIAPESAGDLFDATEIDEILTLRVRTMTPAEKADARGTDPRAAAFLARCDALRPVELERLHGGRRDAGAIPWWDAVQ
ncbi:MAG: Uncharacterized protein JWL64_1260 [Frankiales bacterium]|nr:Uncharacterized protein [Frankiales bacterium]